MPPGRGWPSNPGNTLQWRGSKYNSRDMTLNGKVNCAWQSLESERQFVGFDTLCCIMSVALSSHNRELAHTHTCTHTQVFDGLGVRAASSLKVVAKGKHVHAKTCWAIHLGFNTASTLTNFNFIVTCQSAQTSVSQTSVLFHLLQLLHVQAQLHRTENNNNKQTNKHLDAEVTMQKFVHLRLGELAHTW